MNGQQGRRRWLIRFIGRVIISVIMLMGSVASLFADETISVYCHLGDRIVGTVTVFDVAGAGQSCNSMYYDCRGRCIGCFQDSDYIEDVCVDVNGRTFLR